MSKKIISLLTAVIIASSVLCSCGSDKESTETHDTTTTTIATTTEETSLRLPPKVTVSEFSLKKEKTQSEATSTTKLKTTKKTETTTTKKPEEKTAEKPVPDIINKMLETTDPDYKGQPGGPAAAFMTYYGYRGHEGTQQDVMWFQDMDGDNVPDLVVGGYSTAVDGIQGRVHCFEIQLSNGNGGDIVHLLLDNSSKSKHGHEAFMMQAYKDKNGTLMFTHTQFYAYTSGDPDMDMNYAGTFTIYEYSFAGGKGDSDKKQILYYTYDPRNGSSESAFSCTDGSEKKITASAAKQLYNSYYSSKTPLAANVKTINYQKYMREMTQQQRKQVLMDSYYAFSYTEKKSIAPYGKEVFDKMPSAAATAATTTTTTKKPQNSADNIYASYSAVLSSAKNRMSSAHAISYMVFDYDRDGKSELIIHYMTGARIGEAEIYEYNSNSGKSVLEAQGPCLALIGYSDKIGGLITTTVSNVPVRPNSPSGASVVICKIVVAGKEISYDGVAQLDPDLDKELISEYTNSKKEFADVDTNGCTADAVRANAAKNKAA